MRPNPHKPMPSILIIEDDPDLAGLLHIHLGDLGFETEVVREGRAGLERALSGEHALLILDLMLPGMDGLEICKRLRAGQHALPILMLTARSEEFDKVLGLELGADDYLTKPFSIRELQARVKALLRRYEGVREAPPAETPLISLGALVIDTEKRKVTLHGEVLDLTSKEFELLMLFAANPGRAYSRQELLDIVWGYQYAGYSHTVNTHINRLRNKIESDPADPRFIQTVWGHGYRFAEPAELVP